MAWSIKFEKSAFRDLQKLGPVVAARIIDKLENEVAADDNPRRTGTALKGELKGLWRWRVGDYRIVARLEDQRLMILVVAVDRRKQVYR